MALKWSTVDIPFTQGRDAKVNPKLLPRGRLTELKNLRFQKSGELTNAGRISGETTDDLNYESGASAQKLINLEMVHGGSSGRLLAAANTGGSNGDPSYESRPGVFLYSSAGAAWNGLGNFTPSRIETTSLSEGRNVYGLTAAASDDYIVAAWANYNELSSNYEIDAIVYDRAAKVAIRPFGFPVSASGSPYASMNTDGGFVRVAESNGRFLVFWPHDSSANVRWAIFDAGDILNPAVATADLITDLSGGSVDRSYLAGVGNGDFIFGYRDTSGNPRIRYYTTTASSITQSWTAAGADTAEANSGVAVTYSPDFDATYPVHMAYQESSGNEIRRISFTASGTAFGSNPVSIVNPFYDIARIAMAYDSNEATMAYVAEVAHPTALAGSNSIQIHDENGNETRIFNGRLATGPFFAAGKLRFWMNGIDNDDVGTPMLLMSAGGSLSGSGRYRGAMDAHGLFGLRSDSGPTTMDPIDLGNGKWAAVVPIVESDGGKLGDVAGIKLISCSLDDSSAPVRPKPLELAGGSLFPGGGPSWVGHRSIQSFPFRPQIFLNSVSTGGTIAAGTYSLIAVIYEKDGTNRVARSLPSIPVSVTVGSNDRQIWMEVFVPPGLETREACVALYRTTTADPSTYYYAGESYIGGSFTQLVRARDADATIEANEVIYTSGGELEAGNIFPFTICAVKKDKLIVIPDDNRTTVVESKPLQPGLAPELSPFLSFSSEDGGDFTGIAVQDDYFVLFKSDSVYALQGPGADALGNGAFSSSSLTKLASEHGCTEFASIVETSMGIFFKSRQGICLLDRSLQVGYIGSPVEDFNNLTIRSAHVVSAVSEVRFVCDGSGSGTAVMLVYDLLEKAWSIRDIDECRQASVRNGQMVFGYHDDYQRTQSATPSNWGLPGAYVQSEDADVPWGGQAPPHDSEPVGKIKTGWVRLAGLNGYKRCRRVGLLGDWKSAHTATVKIYQNNDETTPVQTETLSAASDVSPYQWRIRLDNQKCDSIMIEVLLPGGGDTARLTGLSIEVAMIGGIFRSGESVTL